MGAVLLAVVALPARGAQPANRRSGYRRAQMRSATVLRSADNTVKSANATRILTVSRPDGQQARGVFKPRGGERDGIRRRVGGDLFRREIAASQLNDAWGFELVPTTVWYRQGGQVGSLQLFAENTRMAGRIPMAARPVLERRLAEQLRVFDYIIGQRDRHGGNLLIRMVDNQVRPVAIDNGIAFHTTIPERAFRFPPNFFRGHTGPLLAETHALIRNIDLHQTAQILSRLGIERPAIVLTLRRIQRVKNDPSFLRIDPARGVAGTAERMTREGSDETQGLSQQQLQRIDRMVAAVSNSSTG